MTQQRTPQEGDQITYHYDSNWKNKDGKGPDMKSYFGMIVSVDLDESGFTVVWWDTLGNQFSNKNVKVGTKHRQIELRDRS